jgi:hypothetical protein
MLDAVGRSLVEPSAMEPIGAGESVRFDLARCLTAPSNLDGQIKEEPSLGQIYSFFSCVSEKTCPVRCISTCTYPLNKI